MTSGSGPIALIDTSVLAKVNMFSFLARLANAGLFRAKWTERSARSAYDVLEGRRDNGELPSGAFDLAYANLQVVEDWRVDEGYKAKAQDYAGRDDMVTDLSDRYLIAAAVECEAHFIVTANYSDFVDEDGDPRDFFRLPECLELGLVPIQPDEFGCGLFWLNRTMFMSVVETQPLERLDKFINRVAVGMPNTAQAIRNETMDLFNGTP